MGNVVKENMIRREAASLFRVWDVRVQQLIFPKETRVMVRPEEGQRNLIGGRKECKEVV